jgi:hypothetical protein
MKFRERFLSFALEKSIITEDSGRVRLDPYFGESEEALNLAIAACVEAIEQHETMLSAEALVSFDHPDYPLAKSLGKALSLPAVHFMKHPGVSFEGKKVVLVGMFEDETELHGAAGGLRKEGAEVLGAAMLFSQVFSLQQNGDLQVPIARALTEHEVLKELAK